jgi:hypothetical protein
MADEIYGGDLYLIIDDDKFANEQGLTNNETSDVLETTNKHSADRRKTFKAFESTGTISVNGLYTLADPSGMTGYHSLKALQLAGTEIDYEVGYFSNGGVIESGKGVIQNCNLSANRGELVTFDITIQKSGSYSEDPYAS